MKPKERMLAESIRTYNIMQAERMIKARGKAAGARGRKKAEPVTLKRLTAAWMRRQARKNV